MTTAHLDFDRRDDDAERCPECDCTFTGELDDHECAVVCTECDLIECECVVTEPGDDDAFAGPSFDGGCDDSAYDGEYFTGGDDE